MTNRRQFIQASTGAALLGALGQSPAFAQALEQVKIVNGFPPEARLTSPAAVATVGRLGVHQKRRRWRTRPVPLAASPWKP